MSEGPKPCPWTRRVSGQVYLRPALPLDLVVALAGTVGAASAVSAFGRPVLMEGTACKALRNALSDRPASTLSPARNSSLFLTGWASAVARSFRVSSTAYSSLGMVKLSRTSLGFLPLGSVALVGFTAEAALAGLVAAAGLEVGAFSATAFLVGLTALDAFGALGAVAGLVDLTALAGWAAAGAAGVAEGLGVVVAVVMAED